MKKKALHSVLPLFLLLLSSIGYGQESYSVVIPPNTGMLTGGYNWTPGSTCYAVATGNIVASWDCTPGVAPLLRLDFSGFNFYSTTQNNIIDPHYIYVYDWQGLNPSPPIGVYLSQLQVQPYVLPAQAQGTLEITISFYIENPENGSFFEYCIGDLVLPPIEFDCPNCEEPQPVAKAKKIGQYTLHPGPLYNVENHKVYQDISTGGNYQRQWDAYYLKYDQNSDDFTYWHVYSNQPTVDIISSAFSNTPPYEVMGIYSLTLRVWNCMGESEIYVQTSDPRPEVRTDGDLQPLKDKGMAPSMKLKLYPTLLRSGESVNIVNQSIDGNQPIKFQLVSMNGVVVKEQYCSAEQPSFSTEGCAPGTYIVRLTDGKGVVQTEKLLIY